MPRPPRIQFPGAFYHVFNRGVAKAPIVGDDQDRKTFIQFLGETVADFNLKLFAYCILYNHFHFFLQTLLANLSEAIASLQSRYASYFNNRYHRVGHLFQSRFGSRLVETDRYALTLARYIHQNPLEVVSLQTLEDYPWSSYPSYTGKLPKWPWLDTRWLLDQFHSDPAQALPLFDFFHRQRPTNAERKELERRRSFLGKPKIPSFAK